MSSISKILASIEKQHNKGSISSQEYIETILDLSADIDEILASIERQSDKGTLKAKDYARAMKIVTSKFKSEKLVEKTSLSSHAPKNTPKKVAEEPLKEDKKGKYKTKVVTTKDGFTYEERIYVDDKKSQKDDKSKKVKPSKSSKESLKSIGDRVGKMNMGLVTADGKTFQGKVYSDEQLAQMQKEEAADRIRRADYDVLKTIHLMGVTPREFLKMGYTRENLMDVGIIPRKQRVTHKKFEWEDTKSVRVNNALRLKDSNMYIYPDIVNPDIISVISEVEDKIAKKILNEIAANGSLKVSFGITIQLQKNVDESNHILDRLLITRNGFKHVFMQSAHINDVLNFIRDSVAHIIEMVEEFISLGSGWYVEYVDVLHLTFDKYIDMRGGSYIKSPTWIVNKKCCINVRNVDNQCFRYALIAAVKPPAANKERVSYYNSPECKDLFNLDGIPFPTPICSRIFRKFEKQNPKYRLSIFTCPIESKTRESLETCYITDYVDNDTRTNITLLILRGKTTDIPVEEGNEDVQIDDTKWHYTAITNFNALMRYDNNIERHCMRCLHAFAG